MKRKVLAVVAVAAALLVGSVAYNAWSQDTSAPPPAGQVDVKALRAFQKETLPVRDELMVKKLELGNEYRKANPDYNRITTLRKDIVDLQGKIQIAAQKHGLDGQGPGWKAGRGGGYGPGYGRGYGGGPRGGYGHYGRHMWDYGTGPRGGYGGGYGPGNCPLWR